MASDDTVDGFFPIPSSVWQKGSVVHTLVSLYKPCLLVSDSVSFTAALCLVRAMHCSLIGALEPRAGLGILAGPIL